MPTFKKKPVEIEARRLYPDKVEDIAHWCGGGFVREIDALDPSKTFVGINVPTPDGPKRAQEGDWIVKDQYGAFYIMKPAIFQMTYEDV